MTDTCRSTYVIDTVDHKEPNHIRLDCSCGARSGWTSLTEVQRIERAHLDQALTDEDVAANLEARLVTRGGPSANPIYSPEAGHTARGGIREFNEYDTGLAASGR